ncbi:MAG: DUF1543 domain-containing protein [Parvularculaceae bacterium]|nr:DUF1543 domain-containing protein [Parvularculaceae bacterium]
MSKLWVVVVGGYPPGAHVEVHDTRFAIGDSLAEVFSTLKEEWWGGPESRFHFDAWGVLDWTDGHDVVISEEAPEGAASDMQLWFVNLGGYRDGVFAELHKDVFVVAPNKSEAKVRALAMTDSEGWTSPHRDALMTVEATVEVSNKLPGIHLVPNTEERPFTFEAKYLPKV